MIIKQDGYDKKINYHFNIQPPPTPANFMKTITNLQINVISQPAVQNLPAGQGSSWPALVPRGQYFPLLQRGRSTALSSLPVQYLMVDG